MTKTGKFGQTWHSSRPYTTTISQLTNTYMRFRCSGIRSARDGGAYFEVGWGAENSRWRRELVGGSGGILPQKILKSIVSEIVFTAFSARYFLK